MKNAMQLKAIMKKFVNCKSKLNIFLIKKYYH